MTRPGASVLEVRNLSVSFTSRRETIQAVRSVDLSLKAGACLAIVGESGSGKSVTARSLLGLVGASATVSADRLEFEGLDLRSMSHRAWREVRGKRIGFVHQDALTSLDPLRRIRDEVGEALDVHDLVQRKGRDDAVLKLLRDVAIPDPELRLRQYPHELSGGLRQRALIASAIAAQPSLLIADEPTTALDVTIQAQILDLLDAKRRAGTSVVLISHDLTVVGRTADRIAVMYAGLIMEEGPTADILGSPRHPYTVDLMAAVPGSQHQGGFISRTGHLAPPVKGPGCPYADRCAMVRDRCRHELPPLVGGGGTAVRCWADGETRTEVLVARQRTRPPARADVIVRADGITKRFRWPDGGSKTAVDQISFELRSGEALGIVGESGSGKSTTAQIVLGMLAPDAGSVELAGSPWSALSERERTPGRTRIQIVYQDPMGSFDPRFTVERIIGEGLGSTSRRAITANRPRIIELLKQVGLDESYLSRRPRELSGGQQQRVAIARALGPRPEVLVCDEPVSALDVSIQSQILDLFSSLQDDLGVALLFISHDLGVIRHVCDRVLVMKDGCIVEQGEVEAVFHAPEHPYTQELLSAVSIPVSTPTVQ